MRVDETRFSLFTGEYGERCSFHPKIPKGTETMRGVRIPCLASRSNFPLDPSLVTSYLFVQCQQITCN